MELILGYVGNWGNVVLQLMIAERLSQTLGRLHLTADNEKVIATLKMLGREIDRPVTPAASRYVVRRGAGSPQEMIAGFKASGLPAIELSTCNLRISDWPDLDEARRLFPQPVDLKPIFSRDELVINIRGGNILRGIHRDYPVLPPSFYKFLVERTGLAPTFFGQLGDDAYSETLRAAFPEARFVASLGPEVDFAQLRAANHLVVAVSTFSMLAAWLSTAKAVHFPLYGGVNPFQRPDGDSVPVSDKRYRFYRFPVVYMEPIETLLPKLEAVSSPFSPISAVELESRLSNWPYYKLPLEQALSVFDEAYYCAAYPDVAPQIEKAGMSGSEHFAARGHAKHRYAMRVDQAAYARRYGDAARRVGYGEFRNFYEHYVLAGRFQGYDPCPKDDLAV